MARYSFTTGKRPEDCVKRLDFAGHTYHIHYERTANGLESVEQIFPCQVRSFSRLPERVQRALNELHEDVNEFVIARAVQVLTEWETTHDAP